MSMSNTTKWVKEIRRKTRRKFSSEEKIRTGAVTCQPQKVQLHNYVHLL